jgi:hypothetical protein
VSKFKYTSLFNISADRKLSVLKRLYWLIINILNNSFPNFNIDKKLIIQKYKNKINSKLLDKIDNESSPARILCDIFWMSFPWKKISHYNNNNKINFLEIGAGKGVYANLLNNLLIDNLSVYTGVDINYKKEWDSFDKSKFVFYKDTSDNILNYINDHNVIFTQSAIEHFENDLLFFKKISTYLDASQKNILQIHLFPSTECLGTYLWHGYRQYSPRNISKITKLFDERYNKILFKLGSSRSNYIHKKFITYPKIFRKKDLRFQNNKEYKTEFLHSLSDAKKIETSFYALIISSKNGYNINLSDF